MRSPRERQGGEVGERLACASSPKPSGSHGAPPDGGHLEIDELGREAAPTGEVVARATHVHLIRYTLYRIE